MKLNLLVNTQMIWTIFIKILMNTIQVKNIFDDVIADMLITELLARRRETSISLVFITQSNISVPKNIRLNSRHYFIMNVPNKQELQPIAIDHLPGIDFKDFMNFFKQCTVKPHTFLINDTTLASDNPLIFRVNLSERM